MKYIISTHIHIDHAGATNSLINFCPNATVFHHYKTSKHLIDPERLIQSTIQTDAQMAEAYGKPKPVSNDRIIDLHSGEDFSIDNFELEVIDAPGHHVSHFAIYERSTDTLFAGDSAGWLYTHEDTQAILPTTPPPRFDMTQYKKTLQNHIKLDPSILAFTHFSFLTADIQEVLLNSIEITDAWVNLVKEKRKEDPMISIKQMTAILIEKYHPQFKNMEQNLQNASFGVPISGIFYYLDRLEKISL